MVRDKERAMLDVCLYLLAVTQVVQSYPLGRPFGQEPQERKNKQEIEDRQQCSDPICPYVFEFIFHSFTLSLFISIQRSLGCFAIGDHQTTCA